MKLRDEHYENLEKYLMAIGLKDVTYKKHLLYFGHFVEMFGGFLTQKAIDSFLTQKTTPAHRAMISHLINLLKRDDKLTPEEQLEVSRLVILKRVGRKEIKPIQILTKEEIKKLVSKCNLGNELNTMRFKLMVLWQYTSGLRISEVCNLRWEHLKYNGRSKLYEEGRDKLKYQKLYITPDIAKGNKGSPFYVRTDVYLAFFDYFKEWSKSNPSTASSIVNNARSIWAMNKKKYSKLFKEQVFFTLGFRLPHNKSTHILRHSICTHLLMDGMPLLEVRNFMRHSSVKETERYLHLLEDSVSDRLEKITE